MSDKLHPRPTRAIQLLEEYGLSLGCAREVWEVLRYVRLLEKHLADGASATSRRHIATTPPDA